MRDDKLKSLIRRFFELRGIGLTDQELSEKIADFSAIASILNMAENDEVFGFLVINEAYRSLNAEEVAKLRAAFSAMRTDAEKTAIADVKTEIAAALHEAAAKSAKSAAAAHASKSVFMWLGLAFITVSLVLGGFGWFMQSRGFEAGKAAGYAAARDEALILKKRDGFADTPLGGVAFDLAQKGELKAILNFGTSPAGRLAMSYDGPTLDSILSCSRKGWKIRDENGRRACVPSSGSPFWIYGG